MYTKAAIALHNFLRTADCSAYCPPGFLDGEDGGGHVIAGEWRREDNECAGLGSLGHTASNRYSYT